jgi:hypothetical protein
MDDRNQLARLIDPMSIQNFLRARNRPATAPGSELDWYTHLPPADEQAFQQWAKLHGAPVTPDYDMRGFWRALRQGGPTNAATGIDPNDQRLHYTDTWKTPLHESFSAESRFAGPGAGRWNDLDQLVAPDGRVLFDDRQGRR